jgi:FkbM family methyltransferase
MSITSVARNLVSFARTGRRPSRRALAALAKLHGHRLERRWPFLPRAGEDDLNLGFDDVLEFQFARSREFWVMVVGAHDGVENDPVGSFLRRRPCRGILVEPQPAIFAQLQHNLGAMPGLHLVNAAVDRVSGKHDFYYVPGGIEGLPHWTTQLASFSREHIVKHETRAPGVTQHIATATVETVSFDDLLDRYAPPSLDILQIDAEGMDAQLLGWFPFERMKPGTLHYEISHMSADELERTRARLGSFGYKLFPVESRLDEIAVLV